jgi:hypothetical protein
MSGEEDRCCFLLKLHGMVSHWFPLLHLLDHIVNTGPLQGLVAIHTFDGFLYFFKLWLAEAIFSKVEKNIFVSRKLSDERSTK